jgi:voltage-gated potassium channel Kch
VETRRAIRIGLLLSQGGEFAFVLFAAARDALLVEPEAASLFAAIVTVSMASTPFLMMFNDWLDRRRGNREADGMGAPDFAGPSQAIVVGYGRFGQTVAQMMMAKGIPVTLIDSKPAQIELVGSFGMKVHYGDGTRVDLLRLAGAGEARAILFCTERGLSPHRLEPILLAFPQAAIMVRTYDRYQLIEFRDLDLKFAIREVFESAVKMGREALALFCVDEAEVDRVEAEYRRRDAERLDGQASSGDIFALKESLFGPDNPIADREPSETGSS